MGLVVPVLLVFLIPCRGETDTVQGNAPTPPPRIGAAGGRFYPFIQQAVELVAHSPEPPAVFLRGPQGGRRRPGPPSERSALGGRPGLVLHVPLELFLSGEGGGLGLGADPGPTGTYREEKGVCVSCSGSWSCTVDVFIPIRPPRMSSGVT